MEESLDCGLGTMVTKFIQSRGSVEVKLRGHVCLLRYVVSKSIDRAVELAAQLTTQLIVAWQLAVVSELRR